MKRWIAVALVGAAMGLLPVVGLAQDVGGQVLMSDGSMGPAQAGDETGATDPPSQVARISVLNGNVSYEPASEQEFGAAEMNYPLTTGDRLYTDDGASAEVETGIVAVRLGGQTDMTVTGITDALQQFGLAQGSVHMRTFGLDGSSTVEMDTPNVAVSVLQAGDVRVDVDPNSDSTTVSVLAGQVQVDGEGVQQVLNAGEKVRFLGAAPVASQWMRIGRQDGLDEFSAQRDGLMQTGAAAEDGVLDAGTIGGDDLAQSGDWSNDVTEGPVWYPRGVAVDWQPYRCGHWAWIAPWGWTWVECESWGFAPFHYGRWSRFGSRWGWIPGPVGVRPVWSPALVVFVGQPGVTAWFPLGPREPFVPWYHASPVYVNRVNVTNLYSRNLAEVRRVYNERRTNMFADEGDRAYVNRQRATVAMPQASFAAGKPAAQNVMRGPMSQWANAPVIPHPLVTPQRTLVVQGGAKALPPRVERPVLASHEDTAVRPGGMATQGSGGPQRRMEQMGVAPAGSGGSQPAPISRPVPVQPAGTQPVTGERGPNWQPRNGGAAVVPSASPAAPGQGVGNEPVRSPAARQMEQMTPAAVPAPAPARPLFNKAVPPEPRPSFEQQRQAIESSDPGRPLSPEQMQNVRRGQPVAQPQEREVPHPAPAPRPAAPAPATPRPEEKKR